MALVDLHDFSFAARLEILRGTWPRAPRKADLVNLLPSEDLYTFTFDSNS
jgi:hypothetical protein